jgi:hypothetical protein
VRERERKRERERERESVSVRESHVDGVQEPHVRAPHCQPESARFRQYRRGIGGYRGIGGLQQYRRGIGDFLRIM